MFLGRTRSIRFQPLGTRARLTFFLGDFFRLLRVDRFFAGFFAGFFGDFFRLLRVGRLGRFLATLTPAHGSGYVLGLQ